MGVSMNDESGAVRAAAPPAHFVTLDGLRGVAAFAVLFFHRRWWIGPGSLHFAYLAVDFFFVLSGFVIAHAYWNRLAARQLSLPAFTRLRAERLGPLVAVGATLGVAAQVLAAVAPGRGSDIANLLAAWPLALILLPVPWFDDPFLINGPSWSLFFEVAGNLVFAALVPFLDRKRLVWLSAVAAGGIVLVGLVHGNISVGFKWSDLPLGMVRMAAPFLIGALIHRLWVEDALPKIAVPAWVLALILVASLALVPPLGPGGTVVYQLFCVLVLFPVIVIAGLQNEPGRLTMPLAKVGAELSYPVYILHMPLLVAFTAWHGEWPPHTRLYLLGEVAVITIIALAASRLFDIPVRRWLALRRKRTVPTMATA
jgi:peptidoglycan/LPS O-acetylase OafA/YrhL